MTRILLTGATGFVGGATAFRLLHDARVEQLVLLVRGDSQEHARQRLRRSLDRFGETAADWARVRVLQGDLLTVLLDRDLIDSLTHVVHAAACTSFRSVREVRRSNVHGTLALADQLKGGRRLQRFLHVSTAFRCGAKTEAVVCEESLASDAHVVEYTRSKAAAEAWLETMTTLPWMVARPSVVIGHTELGVSPSTSLYWYYRALAEAGIAPMQESRHRDVVAVDYVADALSHLLFLPAPRHRHYHVSAGAISSNTWGEIRLALGQSRMTQSVAAADLARHSAWNRLVGDSVRFRAALDLCARFASVPVEWFANERLLESGLPPPAPFSSYLPRCLESSGRTLLELLDDDA